MNFIKKHKIAIAVSVITIALVVGMLLGLKEMLYPNDAKSAYGNRLNGTENITIPDLVVEDIKKEIMDSTKVNKIDYHLRGRIINFTIEVKALVDLASAKEVASKVLEKLSDEQKKVYDVQVFLTSEDTSKETLFPVIGYKHKTKLIFSWSNAKAGDGNEA